MIPNERASGTSAKPRRWLALCVVGGLVAGAGGLLPSLFGGDATLPAMAPGGVALLAPPPGPSPAAMLGRLAAGTVFVLALCAATLPLLRRWVTAVPATSPGADFEVVATLPLAGRCVVRLVRAGDQHLLAATDAAGLQALVPVGALPAGDGPADPADAPPPRAPAGIEPRRVGAA